MGNGAPPHGHTHAAQDERPVQGYGLLVAATPGGRHPAFHATEALPALAATPPPVLLGTGAGSVVQLADPGDPNLVLSHLRTAAAHDGPLLVYLAGQLLLDSREHLPHLALTRSTPRTVRYTGLPWHWLAAELGRRPAGSTAVIADLVADSSLWQRRWHCRLEEGLVLYGALAAPPAPRSARSPEYSRALAAVLRAGGERPDLDRLHRLTWQGAGFAEAGGEHLPLGEAPGPSAPGQGQFTAPAHGPAPGWPTGEASGARVSTLTAQFAAPVRGQATAQVPPPLGAGAAACAASASAAPAAPLTPPPPPSSPPAAPPAQPLQTPAQQQAPAAPPASPPPSARPPAPPAGDDGPKTAVDVPPGVHQAVYQAASEGRHGEAAAIASQWETAALRAYGPHSMEAVHWVEVRADLAHRAGDAARACTLWLQAAAVRLQTGQAPGAAEVYGAVDRAHHCWHQVDDPAEAYQLGVQLSKLREQAPGIRPGALRDVRERLASLAPPAGPADRAAAG